MALANTAIKQFLQKTKYLLVPLTYLLAGVLFYGDHLYMLPTTLIVCFLTAYYLMDTSKKWQWFWAFVPLWLLILVPSLLTLDFKRSILYLLGIPLSMLLGLWAKKGWFVPKLMGMVLLALFLGKFGYPSVLLALTDDSTFYDTKPFPSHLVFVDKTKDTIPLDKKITVLDFWNTACKPCFEKFPYFEKVSEKYNHPDIAFYSINVPLEDQEFAARTQVETRLGYSYTTLYAEDLKKVQEALNFNAYPHLIIVQDSTIIYSGTLVTGESIYIDNLDKQLAKITLKAGLHPH
ncbi:MAG: hypothetical protein ABGX00_00185 [Allomuricauda sp.]